MFFRYIFSGLRLLRIHLHCQKPRFAPWIRKIPLKKRMATHSSVLVWRIPWTEEPDGLQSMGSQDSDTTEWLNHNNRKAGNGTKQWLLLHNQKEACSPPRGQTGHHSVPDWSLKHRLMITPTAWFSMTIIWEAAQKIFIIVSGIRQISNKYLIKKYQIMWYEIYLNLTNACSLFLPYQDADLLVLFSTSIILPYNGSISLFTMKL